MKYAVSFAIFLLISLSISGCAFSTFDATAWKTSILDRIERPKSSTQYQRNTHEEVNSSADCIVLIHGLWRSAFAMRSIESFLVENGYFVENISYPSTEGSIHKLANDYVLPAVKRCSKKSKTTHLVTHSMGGILAQAFLQQNRLNSFSKIVMLSPPSKGSELAKQYKDNDFFGFFAGKPAMTLHQDEGGVINSFKAFPERLGVIAAYRNWSLWPEFLLPSPNDGMVSLQSMITEGMDDLVLVNSGHAMMRYSDEVKHQTLKFLQTGAFDHK